MLDRKHKLQKQTVKKTPLTTKEVRQLETRYRCLASKLGGFESLSQGSVMPQLPSAWIWTRKVHGKTVTRGLSATQAEKMKLAIANHRALEGMIREMREITQKLILQSPEVTDLPSLQKRPKYHLS